jgi:hypothetical protein
MINAMQVDCVLVKKNVLEDAMNLMEWYVVSHTLSTFNHNTCFPLFSVVEMCASVKVRMEVRPVVN